MVANADGSGERKLVMRREMTGSALSGPSWSPDGKTIACAAGSDTGGTHMTVTRRRRPTPELSNR